MSTKMFDLGNQPSIDRHIDIDETTSNKSSTIGGKSLLANPVSLLTNTPLQVLQKNDKRKRVILCNAGAVAIIISYGAKISGDLTTFTFILQPNGTANWSIMDDNQWQGDVWAASQAGTATLQVTEFV